MNFEKQKENFKNHRAIFKDLGNIKMDANRDGQNYSDGFKSIEECV